MRSEHVDDEAAAVRFPCPCCGRLVFDGSPGSYEICPVCFWEDDLVQLRWPSFEGGANRLSLVECQRNFQDFGAKESRVLKHVRPARESEPVDEGWFPLGLSALVCFEPLEDHSAPWPDDRTCLYWWRLSFWRVRPQE